MEFLNDLRKKPSHIRTRVAFGSALGITLLIALIWSTTLPARLSEIGGTIKEGTDQTAAVQTGLDTLIEGIQQEVVPEEELVNEEDPAVEQLKIEAMGSLEMWSEESSTSSTSGEGVTSTSTTQVVATSSPEASNENPPSPQKEKVILIGTTTKKAE